jgi:hypothetical protein
MFIYDMPDAEYQSARQNYITAHALAEFRRDPYLYWRAYVDPNRAIVRQDSPTFAFGRAAHVMILEGREKYLDSFVIADGPINESTGKPYGNATKAYAEWYVSQTMPIVSIKEHLAIEEMEASIEAHPIASRLLEEGAPEVVVRNMGEGHHLQCRIDWWNESKNQIVDLKTCESLEKFKYQIKDFGYIQQLAWYASMVLREQGRSPDFPPECYIIAAEKAMPYRVAVYRLENMAEHIASILRDLAILAEYMQNIPEIPWQSRWDELQFAGGN